MTNNNHLEFIKTICNKQSEKKAMVDINKINYFPENKIKHFDNIHDGYIFYKNQPDFKDLPDVFIDSLIEHDLKKLNL